MKILYGITKSNFGGAQRYVFDLAVESQRRGNDTIVLCGGEGLLVQKLREEKIKTISLSNLKRDVRISDELYSFFQILKILKEERPDTFHINSSKMGGLGALAGRLAGIKNIIFTAHGWEFNAPRPLWQKIVIKFFSWLIVVLSHKTICVSEKTRNDISSLPFISNKVVVIRNGIENFSLFARTEAREKLLLPENSFVVGTIAELHRVKGLDVLLNAWEQFLKTRTGILAIIGGGEEENNLKNMAKNKDILNSVKFFGFVPEARSLLKAFDVFVLSSRSEALPYVPLEAGSASLPVLATDVGGVPEIICNGKNGILVEKENPQAIASSLILLEENRDLRERLGAQLRKTVEENFSRTKMIEETFANY